MTLDWAYGWKFLIIVGKRRYDEYGRNIDHQRPLLTNYWELLQVATYAELEITKNDALIKPHHKDKLCI